MIGAIELPRSQFDLVLDRLTDRSGRSDGKRARCSITDAELSFLTHRSSTEFLLLYLERDSNVISAAFDIDTPLENHVPERDLARRLLDEGIVGESHRLRMAARLIEWAVTGEDASFLDDDRWLGFLTDDELAELDRRVRSETMGQLETLLAAEISRWSPPSPAIVEPSLDAYIVRYPEFAAEIASVHEALLRHEPEPDADKWVRNEIRTPSTPMPAPSARSIFDDLV